MHKQQVHQSQNTCKVILSLQLSGQLIPNTKCNIKERQRSKKGETNKQEPFVSPTPRSLRCFTLNTASDFSLFSPFLGQHLKTPPQSVVLVGHSMGGVVARALYTLPRFNTNLVSLIITQASPHLAPVLALDPYLLGKENYHAGLERYIDEEYVELELTRSFLRAIKPHIFRQSLNSILKRRLCYS